MNRLIWHVNSILLRMSWIFMSPQEKYAYLWAKTKNQGE